jgi:hypothetical protein
MHVDVVTVPHDDDVFVVPKTGSPVLSWNRDVQKFRVVDDFTLPTCCSKTPSVALFGVLSLTPVQNVLMTVTSASEVCALPGNHKVFLVSGMDWRMLPGLKLPPTPSHGSTPKSSLHQCEQLPPDVLAHYLDVIRNFCACRDASEGTHFYFSPTADLSHPFNPKCSSVRSSAIATSPIDDLRGGSPAASPGTTEPLTSATVFQWNRRLTTVFPPGFPHMPSIIRGFVGDGKIKGCPGSVFLCSRQSCLHAGTRYNARGIDDLGIPANFILSEQIVWNPHSGMVSSYRLLRGSVPRRWEQPADLTFKPKMTITGAECAKEEVVLHLGVLGTLYGDCEFHCVDTTSTSQLEAPLSAAFATGVAEYAEQVRSALSKSPQKRIPHCLYTKVNIGHKISSLSADELARELHALLGHSCARQGVSLWRFENTGGDFCQLQEQQGYFRVNCLDCLDRTNVTQALLARAVLREQLPLCHLDAASFHEAANTAAISLWMGNGSAISHLYAGTDPHFLDFISSGRRSASGYLASARIALQRYFQANFRDGRKQDALALVTGQHDAQTSCTAEGSPFQRRMTGLNALVVLGISVAVASLVLCGFVMLFLTPRWRLQLAILQCLWIFFLCVAAYLMRRHARSFTNYPILK